MTSTTILSDNGVSSGSAGLKNTAGNDGKLLLQTTTAGGAATTAITIDNSQNVGIGTSSPSANLDISSSNGSNIRFTSTTTTQVEDANTGYISFYQSDTSGSGAGTGTTAKIAAVSSKWYNSGTYQPYFGTAARLGFFVNSDQASSSLIEALSIVNGGNVGVGTTSPTTKLHIQGNSSISTSDWYASSATARLQAASGNSTQAALVLMARGPTGAPAGTSIHAQGVGSDNYRASMVNTITGDGTGQAYWSVNNFNPTTASTAELCRVTYDGNLLVGTTTARSKLVVEGGQISVGSTGATSQGIYLYINNALSDNSYLSRGSAGTGTTTWYIGNQSITTSSDQRLKADIKPSERNALNLLNQWEIVDHTWNDPSDQCENNRNSRGVWTGVVAQQVQQVTPWLVNKPIEDVNEDGSINPWTMDFGYAVPLLVKAIQEQQALITTLTERITALEGAKA